MHSLSHRLPSGLTEATMTCQNSLSPGDMDIGASLVLWRDTARSMALSVWL